MVVGGLRDSGNACHGWFGNCLSGKVCLLCPDKDGVSLRQLQTANLWAMSMYPTSSSRIRSEGIQTCIASLEYIGRVTVKELTVKDQLE
jgi:hypothetical protein